MHKNIYVCTSWVGVEGAFITARPLDNLLVRNDSITGWEHTIFLRQPESPWQLTGTITYSFWIKQIVGIIHKIIMQQFYTSISTFTSIEVTYY